MGASAGEHLEAFLKRRLPPASGLTGYPGEGGVACVSRTSQPGSLCSFSAASTRSPCGAAAGSPARPCASPPPRATGTVWTSLSARGPRWTWWTWRDRRPCTWLWWTGTWRVPRSSWRPVPTPMEAGTTAARLSTTPHGWAGRTSWRPSSGQCWGSGPCHPQWPLQGQGRLLVPAATFSFLIFSWSQSRLVAGFVCFVFLFIFFHLFLLVGG